MKWAALFPVVLIGYGIVTSVPWLFNLIGLALFVALVREGGKYVIPWPKVRRLMLLDKIDNPSPTGVPEGVETEEHQVRRTLVEDRPGHWKVVWHNREDDES